MKILITDDHAVVRQGYASLLSVLLDPCEVIEAGSGEEVCSKVTEQGRGYADYGYQSARHQRY